MRCTQFGHQVPRKKSAINTARRKKPDNVKIPSRLAASSENSGARAPTRMVSV